MVVEHFSLSYTAKLCSYVVHNIEIDEGMRNILSSDPPPPYAAGRHDGWTTARQAEFLRCLARHGLVTAACDSVGMRCASAYRLRRRPDAAAFAAAWDACLTPAVDARPTPRRESGEGCKGVEGQDVTPRHQFHQLRPPVYDLSAFIRAADRFRPR